MNQFSPSYTAQTFIFQDYSYSSILFISKAHSIATYNHMTVPLEVRIEYLKYSSSLSKSEEGTDLGENRCDASGVVGPRTHRAVHQCPPFCPTTHQTVTLGTVTEFVHTLVAIPAKTVYSSFLSAAQESTEYIQSMLYFIIMYHYTSNTANTKNSCIVLSILMKYCTASVFLIHINAKNLIQCLGYNIT